MRKWKEKLPILGFSLILGIAAFVGLLWLERQSLKDLEKKNVIVCKETCVAGETITEKNVNDFFSVVAVPKELVTSTTVADLQEVIGYYPDKTISAGEILYTGMLQKENLTENMESPVEISVTAEIDYAVAGRIRKGDCVNVYVRDNQSSTYELVLEQVIMIRKNMWI